MLTYIVLCITVYLVVKIVRAPCSADATGYLLVSGLIPLPLYMIGRSAQAGVFAIDVCLLVYIVAHGLPAFDYAAKHRALAAGVVALFALSILATCSGFFNVLFVDPGPLKFYAFTIVKFWEYALLATVLIASRPDAVQLRKICTIVLAGILVYEILHALHISGIVPLSGEDYFGPRASEFDLGEMRAAPFSDRTGWFLTSYRVVIGGTASICACFSLMVLEAYRGKIRAVASATAVLAAFSVLATSSRSDIAGLVVAVVIFAALAGRRRWKAYMCASIAAACLYATYLAFILPPAERSVAMDRLSELWNPQLRAEGSYDDRSSDMMSLISYLPEHPRELLIGVGPGNFHWYQAKGITKNFFGHNSYLHWTAELGIGGFFLLVVWCLSVCLDAKKWLRSQNRICQLAARTCLAVVASRMVAAWGAESLFGTQGMGYYSLFFVGVVYLFVSIAFDSGATGFSLSVAAQLVGREFIQGNYRQESNH
jgi:hypothetical protein